MDVKGLMTRATNATVTTKAVVSRQSQNHGCTMNCNFIVMATGVFVVNTRQSQIYGSNSSAAAVEVKGSDVHVYSN